MQNKKFRQAMWYAVDRKTILRDVWDTTWLGSTKTVDVHVASLRKKLGDDGPQVEKGFLTVSNKPGIGVEINEEGMRRHAVPGVPFFA